MKASRKEREEKRVALLVCVREREGGWVEGRERERGVKRLKMLPSPSPPFSLSHTDKGGGGIREEKPREGKKQRWVREGVGSARFAILKKDNFLKSCKLENPFRSFEAFYSKLKVIQLKYLGRPYSSDNQFPLHPSGYPPHRATLFPFLLPAAELKEFFPLFLRGGEGRRRRRGCLQGVEEKGFGGGWLSLATKGASGHSL